MFSVLQFFSCEGLVIFFNSPCEMLNNVWQNNTVASLKRVSPKGTPKIQANFMDHFQEPLEATPGRPAWPNIVSIVSPWGWSMLKFPMFPGSFTDQLDPVGIFGMGSHLLQLLHQLPRFRASHLVPKWQLRQHSQRRRRGKPSTLGSSIYKGTCNLNILCPNLPP